MADRIETPNSPGTGRGQVACRAVSSLRFLPPLSRVSGASTLLSQDGLTFRAYPARNHQDRAPYITEAFDEHRSMARLAHLVRGKKSLVLDIGAKVGIYTVFLARAAGSGSKVISFEPSPTVAARLRENIALNGFEDRVEVEGVALGAKDGEAELSVPLTNFGGASLIRPRLRGGSHKVRQRALANFLKGSDAFERVVLKIDVEGYEDRVLRPMFDTLPVDAWPDALLLEVSSKSRWESDPIAPLRKAGYREVFHAERNKLFLRPGVTE